MESSGASRKTYGLRHPFFRCQKNATPVVTERDSWKALAHPGTAAQIPIWTECESGYVNTRHSTEMYLLLEGHSAGDCHEYWLYDGVRQQRGFSCGPRIKHRLRTLGHKQRKRQINGASGTISAGTNGLCDQSANSTPWFVGQVRYPRNHLDACHAHFRTRGHISLPRRMTLRSCVSECDAW
jgi:hypothetical protein